MQKYILKNLDKGGLSVPKGTGDKKKKEKDGENNFR